MMSEPRRIAHRGELLDSLAAGVLGIASNGEVRVANRAACRLLDRTPDALIGHDVAELFAPLATLSDGASTERRELRVRTDAGTKTFGYSVGVYTDEATGEPCRSVVFQEITAVLELRHQRDRLLQMAALGDALPCILHELKNPLAAISTMLELLVEEAGSTEAENDLYAVLAEVRRIHLTLQGVGGFARPLRTSRHEAIDHAVQEACRVLEPTAARRGVSLRCEGPALPLLPLDRNVLSGAVFNLVRNAIDACGEGASIVVTTTLEGETLVLSVRDTGPGMSPEVAARCTELFYTNKATGSGIGLALCKQIADGSGGSLDVQTAVGVGTTVTLRFPLARPQRSSEAAPAKREH